ncbi:MAG: hypothetical protein ACRDTG_31960 [Pseudonocardiaceae bacterium]
MTSLAISANETAFWVVVGVLVAVLVVGVIALTATLLRIVGSVNQSMRQLQEVVEMQAGQVHAAEPHATRVTEEAVVSGDTTAETAAESAGKSTNGELPAVDGDAKGRKRGGASEG